MFKQLREKLSWMRERTPKKLFQIAALGLCALFNQTNAWSQVSTYGFTQTSGTYTPITGGTVLRDGTSAMDQWVSAAITIPAFSFNQVSYTTAFMSSNGFITLGGSAPSTSVYGVIGSTTGSGIAICPFGADLNRVNSTVASEMRWQTVGNEIVFQWKEFQRYLITESFDMQVRLNTVTGVVTFVYNLNNGPGTSTDYQPQVGIRTSTTDYNNRTVGTTAGQDWATSVAGTSNTSDCRFTGSSTNPRGFVSGQTYIFTPPTCWSPSNLANTNVTRVGATVTWKAASTPAPSGGYEYYVSTSNTAPASSATPTGATTDTFKLLNNLPAATQHYVWVRSSCGANDKGPWIGATNFTTLCATPAPGPTLVSPGANPCANAAITLSMTNPPAGPGLSYVWQSSMNGTAYTNISGATANTLSTTATANYYRCRVVCSAGPDTVYSTPVQINYPNAIASAANVARCGTGTVNLTATANTGATINWYAAATGGAPVGTGSPFTTPYLTASTTYYASAETNGAGSTTVGAGATTSATYSNPFYSAWSNSHNQYLITAAELQSAGLRAGNITSLGIKINSGTTTLQDLSIKMAPTTATNMSAFLAPTFTPVFSAATFTPVVGVNTMTFSTPFNWDGISNIVIEVCQGNSGSTSTVSSTAEADNTSYVSTIHVHKSAATAGASVCTDLTTSLTTFSVRPRFYLNGIVACTSLRVPATVTINTAPAFDVTNDKTVCNTAITTLTVNSPAANYNNVTWSPVTNLYTDAAATVAYVANAHASTVYYKNTTTGLSTYVATASNTTTLCGAVDTVKLQTLPATTTAIAGTATLCNSGTSVLTLVPAITQTGMQYQWQNSTDNTTFADITTSGTSATYTTPSINATRYYRAVIKNSDGAVCFNSVSDTVYVNTPLVATNTPATRCGIGPVTLAATPNAGASISWFTAASGGTAVGTGNSYTTPAISATTTYYAEPSIGSAPLNVGPANNATTLSYYITTDWGITFNATAPTVIQSVAVYPGSAGTMTISVQSGMTSPTIFGTYTATFTAAQVGTKVVLPINVTIPTAGTGYKMIVQSYTGLTGVQRETPPGSGFPYTTTGSPISLINSEWGGTTTGTYYFFYDWVIGQSCKGPRVPVVATVTPPPTFDVTNDKTVCNNAVTTLTVNSPAANFDNVTWTPATNLYTNAAATTAYVAGANASTVYHKSGTAGMTMYTVNALNTTTQCANLDTVKIQTLPATSTAIAAIGTLCQTGSSTLSLTPAITQTGFTYQWQNSANNTTFTDITTNGTGATYTTPTIAATQYYRAVVKNSDGAVCFNSVSDTVVVNNPQLLTTVPGERCGPGTVVLSATTNAGATPAWFSAATGGSALATGTSFTTPSLTATTNYWVAARTGAAGSVTSKIGAGTDLTTATEELTAFCNRRTSYKMQMIFTAAELNAMGFTGGNINGIGFDITTIGDGANNAAYTVKVGPTTQNTFSTYIATGLNTVYGPSTYTHAVGNNVINFAAPYIWDGTSNVVVEITHNGVNSINNAQTYYTTTSSSMTGYSYNTATTATTSTKRPNTTFIFSNICEGPRQQVTATVKTKPAATLTPNGTLNICEGATQTLTAGGVGNYSWLKNNTLIPGQTGTTYSANQTGAYKAVVTNSVGCTDTSVAANLTVNPKPVVNLGNDTSVCANVALTLDAQNPGAAYLWNDNSTNSTLTAAAAGQYRVKVTNTFNCVTSDTINIAHLAVPVVNLGNDTMICHVVPLTLDAQNAGNNYVWNTGATTQTINVNQAGTYSVDVTNSNNCTGTDAIVITVMPNPVNDGFNFITLFNEAIGKIRFEPINVDPTYTYAWNFGDGNTSTQTNPVHTYAAAGDYLVSLDISNGCTDTTVTLPIKIDFLTGTATVTKNNINMKLYPNPAQDQLNLELVGDHIFFKNIVIHNVIGQKVIDLKTTKTAAEKISIQALPAGMYVLKAETDKGIVIRKFEIIK